MRCAHTVAQVRDSEAAAFARLEAEGRPEEALMRRAAAGLAYAVADYLRGAGGSVYGARVVVLAGAGNNGGDAMYAAAALADRGARVGAPLLRPPEADSARSCSVPRRLTPTRSRHCASRADGCARSSETTTWRSTASSASGGRVPSEPMRPRSSMR